MYYGAIKDCDIADGEGVRVSLFVSGCRNCCEGCFQPETWSFTYGEEYTEETEEKILKMLGNPWINGLTILGGEPFEPENQPQVCQLLEKAKERYPGKNIWSYSGYTFEVMRTEGSHPHTEYTERMLSCIDILVDGKFVQEKKNIRLNFRGSENQRIIDVQASLAAGQVVLSPLNNEV